MIRKLLAAALAALAVTVPAATPARAASPFDPPAWLVSTQNGDWPCTGTMIRPQWVVTAAGCLWDSRDSYVIANGEQIRGVTFRVHGYLTLVKLAKPVPGAGVMPLATADPAPGTLLQRWSTRANQTWTLQTRVITTGDFSEYWVPMRSDVSGGSYRVGDRGGALMSGTTLAGVTWGDDYPDVVRSMPLSHHTEWINRTIAELS